MKAVSALHVSHYVTLQFLCNCWRCDHCALTHPLPGEVLGVPGHWIHRECGLRPKRAKGMRQKIMPLCILLLSAAIWYLVLQSANWLSIDIDWYHWGVNKFPCERVCDLKCPCYPWCRDLVGGVKSCKVGLYRFFNVCSVKGSWCEAFVVKRS